jgi:peptidoglycan/LPS O-acetylase OafA/YrhL
MFRCHDMRRVAQLDGVRGVAIILVLVWHYLSCSIVVEPDTWASYALIPFRLSWSGVDLFFVLSGFLIVGILCDHRHSSNFFKAFYFRRICRIFPLYYLLILLFLLLGATQASFPSKEWLLDNPLPLWSYATFTQNIFMGLRGDFGANFLGITWSLAIEEQFYLFIPLLVYLLPKRRLFLVLAIGVLMAPILRSVSPAHFSLVNTLWRSDSLLTGGCLAILVRWHPFAEGARSHRGYLWVLLCVFLAVAGVWLLNNPQLGGFIHFWLGGLYGLFVLIAFVSPDGSVTRYLNHRTLVWCGQRSYGIYMYHQAVNGLVQGLLLRHPSPEIRTWTDALVTVLALCATLSLAYISYRFIENPILQYGHRMKYLPQLNPVASEPVGPGTA